MGSRRFGAGASALAVVVTAAVVAAAAPPVAPEGLAGPALRAAGVNRPASTGPGGGPGRVRAEIERLRPVASARSETVRAKSARAERAPRKSTKPELYAPAVRDATSAGSVGEVRQPVSQTGPLSAPMPSPTTEFAGIGATGYVPPDTVGDVGPNHYVQAVNVKFQVFDKTGTPLTSAVGLGSLWTDLPGTSTCEAAAAGDPIVLYDEIADRWLISQFAFYDFGPAYDYHQCFAISATSDPTGAYHLYDYLISDTLLNDYPHIGVWPDGYYVAINQFDEADFSFAGAATLAFDREAMIEGDANAAGVIFDLGSDPSVHSLLPSDLDGPILPPYGAPNYFTSIYDGGSGQDRLRLFEMQVNWAQVETSTFTETASIAVNDFDSGFGCADTYGQCIPQPGTSERLDQLSDRLMYRLAYRNLGTHESLVVNHTVDAGSDTAAIRVYEVRDPGGPPTAPTFQTTLNLGDGVHRWMGSAALDLAGNIALGYTAANGSVYPSIRYSGWVPNGSGGYDLQTETTMEAGAGSQTNVNGRWGDYSAMSVDPSDGCTFWYTTEYMTATSTAGWSTRVGSFKICTATLPGSLAGTVTDEITGAPLAGVLVMAGDTYGVRTGSDGTYNFPGLPAGSYTVTASKGAAFDRRAQGAVSVADGAATSGVNFSLRALGASDFNGDGEEDLAVGVPYEDVNGDADAGAVQIVYGGTGGASASGDELLHQDVGYVNDSTQRGERFGASVASGDFNGDGYSDLAVGIPGEDVGDTDAGAVHVFYGGASGLVASNGKVYGDRMFTQDTTGVEDSAEPYDRFGHVVATGDVNGDGYADLLVGVPYENNGSEKDTGAVAVLLGSASGVTASGDQVWTQDSSSGGYVDDTTEPYDRFGSALAVADFDGDGSADVAIGVPGEDVNGDANAGAVSVLRGASSGLTGANDQWWHQDVSTSDGAVAGSTGASDAFGSSLAAGDLEGDGYPDLAIGVPGEDSGGDNGAGAVAVLYTAGLPGLSAFANQLWHQDVGAVNGTTQSGDAFGASVAVGDLNGDGYADLAIGVPGDNSGGDDNAGAVAVLYSAGNDGLSDASDQLWHQDVGGIASSTTRHDRFGASVAVAHVKGGLAAALLVGVPGEDLAGASNAGALAVLYGVVTSGVGATGDQLWHQDVTNVNDVAEGSDRFGSSVA